MSIVQRSIPFPPIRLQKIIKYLTYISDKTVSISELKDNKIDFGRGRGDITRFLTQIEIVYIENSKVKLTGSGKILRRFIIDSKPTLIFKILFHNYIMDRILTYNILIHTLERFNKTSLEDLFHIVNEELKTISPSIWMNKVAYRSLISIASDLEVLERHSSTITYIGHTYRVRSIIELCITSKSDIMYIDISKLSELLGFPDGDMLVKILERQIAPVKAPRTVRIYRVRDIESLVKNICKLTVEEVMKFSSPER